MKQDEPGADPTPAPDSEARPSLVDRGLRLFADVRAGESGTALLLLANVFLAMFAYYVIKTIRESLILRMEDGAELKSYASGAMAITLVLVLPAYNWLTSNVSTKRLLFSVVGFFLLCTEAFFLALQFDLQIGFVFFIWVGIYSLSTIALFWSFANEVYTRDEGERLFPVIGIGMTGGAWAGSALAGQLFGEDVSPGLVLQVAVLAAPVRPPGGGAVAPRSGIFSIMPPCLASPWPPSARSPPRVPPSSGCRLVPQKSPSAMCFLCLLFCHGVSMGLPSS